MTMKKLLLAAVAWKALVVVSEAAIITVNPWQPLFQGIDYATGRQEPDNATERLLAISCLRIDLANPEVVLFTSPHCTNNCGQETLSENTSHFLESYGLSVAINGAFYRSSTGPNDTPLGTPDDVFGLAMSLGEVVSPAENSAYAVTFLFTTNNVPTFIPRNWPGPNTDGIFTAISGNAILLTNGVNVGTDIMDYDPRTAFGLSEDSRYLYLMTIDGRQSGWSQGANFYQTAEWLIRFGAYHGINVDGGGSTTMCLADCQGKSVRLNRSSYVFQYGRERNIGHNFGVYAKPLLSPIMDLNVAPSSTTALLTWRTDFPATTQVEYGLATNYGSSTALDARMLKTHIATLPDLLPGSNYFFRAISSDGTTEFSLPCRLTTTNPINQALLLDITNSWKYTTNNLDGVNWRAPNYNDSAWLGPEPGLLYKETSQFVAPKSTLLPPGDAGYIVRTYYFRTHFDFSGSTEGLSLTFSNYVDDGAVFYLNGTQIQRLRVPQSGTISNATSGTASACPNTTQQGDAVCPDLFTISGSLLTNLVQGDNVLAVEVHNAGSLTSASADIVFGSALIATRPGLVLPTLFVSMNEDATATLYWNGSGFTLQQSSDLSSTSNWIPVTGPATNSPVIVTNGGTWFYRLRQ